MVGRPKSLGIKQGLELHIYVSLLRYFPPSAQTVIATMVFIPSFWVGVLSFSQICKYCRQLFANFQLQLAVIFAKVINFFL